MSKSARLRAEDWRAILRLVGECRDLGDDPGRWRPHFIDQFCGLVDADFGSSGETSGHGGGAPKSLGVVQRGHQDYEPPGDLPALYATLRDHPELYEIVATYYAWQAREDGIALSRREAISDAAWYPSQSCQLVHTSLGVDHVMWCFRSLRGSPDECCGAMIFRVRGRRDFSARQRAILREAQVAFAPLVGGPLARFADPSPGQLAPRLRQVLACLLEGDGDKQVSARLGLSAYTVNEYTKAIFRHFGVRSRPELLARWVRRGLDHPPAWFDA